MDNGGSIHIMHTYLVLCQAYTGPPLVTLSKLSLFSEFRHNEKEDIIIITIDNEWLSVL